MVSSAFEAVLMYLIFIFLQELVLKYLDKEIMQTQSFHLVTQCAIHTSKLTYPSQFAPVHHVADFAGLGGSSNLVSIIFLATFYLVIAGGEDVFISV